MDRTAWLYRGIFVVWCVLVFFSTGGADGWRPWLDAWHRWDTRWYETIWREGYSADRAMLLAFPPGHPLVVGALSSLLRSPFHWTGTTLSALSYFFACELLADHLAARFRAPRLAVFGFALSSPVAYFAFVPYSDAPFFLLLVALVVLDGSRAEGPRESLRVAALWLLTLAAPWIRLTGYALLSWLLLRRRYAWAILASLAGWLALNAAATGDPLAFLSAQAAFRMPGGQLLEGLLRAVTGGLDLPTESRPLVVWLAVDVLPLIYFLALLALGFWFLAHGERLWSLTTLSILLLSHNQAYWRSGLRYDLPLVPLLCLPLLAGAAERSRGRRWAGYAVCVAIAGAQLCLQLVYARRFHAGRWGF